MVSAGVKGLDWATSTLHELAWMICQAGKLVKMTLQPGKAPRHSARHSSATTV